MAKVFFKHPKDGAMTEGQLTNVKVWQDENLFTVTYQGCSYEVSEVFKDKECGKIDCVCVYNSLGRSDRTVFPLSPKYDEKLVVFPDRHYENLSVAVFEYSVGAGELFFLTAATYRSEDGCVHSARDVFSTYEDMAHARKVWHRDEDGNKIWSDGWIEDLNTFDADQMQIIERFKKTVDEMRDAGIKLVLDQWGDDAWFVNEGKLKERGLGLEWSYEYPDCLYRIGDENHAFRQKCSIGRLMTDDGDCKVYIINKNK